MLLARPPERKKERKNPPIPSALLFELPVLLTRPKMAEHRCPQARWLQQGWSGGLLPALLRRLRLPGPMGGAAPAEAVRPRRGPSACRQETGKRAAVAQTTDYRLLHARARRREGGRRLAPLALLLLGLCSWAL